MNCDDEYVKAGALVKEVFKSLEKAMVEWAVLRRVHELPDDVSYDLDILIREGQLALATSAVKKAATSVGWSFLVVTDKFRYRCCMLISPTEPYKYLPVDLMEGCYYRFYMHADGNFALAYRKRNENDIWAVPPGFGAAESLVKELLRHDYIKENSRSEIFQGSVKDPKTFTAGIAPVVGEPLARKMLEATQRKRWDKLGNMAIEIRQAVVSRRWRGVRNLPAFLWGNIKHHLTSPLSLFVVLLGPDGSGKSTVAKKIEEEMFHNPFKLCRRYEHRFQIIPELKVIYSRVMKICGRQVVTEVPAEPGTPGSGMNPEHSIARGMMYVTYYWFDMVLGKVLVRRLRGQGGLIVFARYFYDYWYQLGYRNVPHWYLRFLGKVVPKPDLVIYLHRDAKEIYACKPELSLFEIKRQQLAIKDLIMDMPNSQIIDGTKGLDATVDEVKKHIILCWRDRAGLVRGLE